MREDTYTFTHEEIATLSEALRLAKRTADAEDSPARSVVMRHLSARTARLIARIEARQ